MFLAMSRAKRRDIPPQITNLTMSACSNIRRRPRVLLIPNDAAWIVGEIGKQIVHALSDEVSFVFYPESLLWRRHDLLRSILPHVSLVHCLNESSVLPLLEIGSALPPIVTTIHHVTHWGAEHQAAVEKSVALTTANTTCKAVIEQHAPVGTGVELVPYGVERARFYRREGARGRLGIERAAFVVGFLGTKASDRDAGRKGLPVMIEVLASALPRISSALALFAGPGWDGVVSDLRRRGVRAQALGFIPAGRVPDFYSAIDAYLITSTVEGGPCTVLESLACGTPVVSTRVGIVPEIVKNGYNGFVVEVGDVDGLTRGLIELASACSLKLEMANRAASSVADRSWSVVLQPLKTLYRRFALASPSSTVVPSWLASGDPLVGPASVADALLLAYLSLRRNRPNSYGRTLQTLGNALSGIGFENCLRGVALATGLGYRSPAGHDLGG